MNPSSRWSYPLLGLTVIFLGLLLYGQTFGFGFVFDDMYFIVNNPTIRRFDHVYLVWHNFPVTRSMGFYSFALNYFFNQLHPQGYHVFNFIIHLLVVGLVWACSLKFFKITGYDHPELAFIIAVLFLVHPCQTQAVSYISQRFESMACLFYLGSIYAYLCTRTTASVKNKIIGLVTCVGLALLGVLTKEVVVTLPVMILAIEWIFFNQRSSESIQYKPWQIYAFIAAAGLLFVVIFTKLVHTNPIQIYFHFHEASSAHEGDEITSGKYLLTQMRVFLTFIRLLILPIHQNLDYDYPLSTGLFNPPLTFVGLALISVMAFLVFKLRQQWPLMAFGLAWILITFSINTAPRINVIFEHKLYLISYGFFLSLVVFLSLIIKNRPTLLGIFFVFIAILSWMTYQRNHVWHDQFSLWNDVIQKSPHKAMAYNNRGLAYFGQEKWAEAIADYQKAIEIRPNYVDAYNNRGLSFYFLGNQYQALLDYNKAIAINPHYAETYFNRGVIYSNQGLIKRAISDYRKAVQINPNEGNAYYNLGLLLSQQGHDQEALDDISKAIAINPDNADFYNNRGLIYIHESQFSLAFDDFNKVVALDPHNAQAFSLRGRCYLHLGFVAEALMDLDQSIVLNPSSPQVYIDRATIYYHLTKYAQALQDLNKVQSLGIKVDPEFLKKVREAS